MLRAVLLLCLSAPSAAAAAPQVQHPVPATRQLQGLTGEEADALVAMLEEAQRRLRAGEFQGFDLLAGAVASYDAARIPARDAFLRARFDQVWDIQRVQNEHLKTYRLAYAPEGLGRRYWDIEVAVSDVGGRLERVRMVYRVPPPF